MRLNLLSLALRVSKLPRINIVDFFITRGITSNKFVLSSLNQEIRLLAILTSLKLLSLVLCVNKFTHTNIVDFFITRSITSNKFVLSSLNQEIRLLAAFRFNRTLCA